MIKINGESIFKKAYKLIDINGLPMFNGEQYLFINLSEEEVYYSDYDFIGNSIIIPEYKATSIGTVKNYLNDLEIKYNESILNKGSEKFSKEFIKYLPNKYDKDASKIIVDELICQLTVGSITLNSMSDEYLYLYFGSAAYYIITLPTDQILGNEKYMKIMCLAFYYSKDESLKKMIIKKELTDIFKEINLFSYFNEENINEFINIINFKSYKSFSYIYLSLDDGTISTSIPEDKLKELKNTFKVKYDIYSGMNKVNKKEKNILHYL